MNFAELKIIVMIRSALRRTQYLKTPRRGVGVRGFGYLDSFPEIERNWKEEINNTQKRENLDGEKFYCLA